MAKAGPPPLLPFVKLFLTAIRPLLGVWLPMIESIRAAESPDQEDAQQWLTYWFIYALLVQVERVTAPILSWIPFYPHFRIAFIGWLVLPHIHGARFIYKHIVRQLMLQAEQKLNTEIIPRKVPLKQKLEADEILANLSPSAREKVEQFIKEQGSEAFEKVLDTHIVGLQAAEEASKRHLAEATSSSETSGVEHIVTPEQEGGEVEKPGTT